MVERFTLVIKRVEYAHIYWNIVELYDAYLVCLMNNVSPNDVEVLVLDAHPATAMDELWSRMFRNVTYPPQLPLNATYRRLTLQMMRRESPMLKKTLRVLPAWSEFRAALLRSFQLEEQVFVRNASRLRVLIVLRRDYVAHPRNPSGHIKRKIFNEKELITALRSNVTNVDINALQLDLLPLREQVRIAANTDILMGMHGAAHVFSIFVQPGGAVIELKTSYESKANWHMSSLSEWSKLFHFTWKNYIKTLDDKKQGYSTLPLPTMINLLQEAVDTVAKFERGNITKVFIRNYENKSKNMLNFKLHRNHSKTFTSRTFNTSKGKKFRSSKKFRRP